MTVLLEYIEHCVEGVIKAIRPSQWSDLIYIKLLPYNFWYEEIMEHLESADIKVGI